ncbi:MAG: hypothetical protein EBT13_06685 [Rhodobacteraceae bacterium]|nr:hypothetical protein [Paracoccaceae bacterium]
MRREWCKTRSRMAGRGHFGKHGKSFACPYANANSPPVSTTITACSDLLSGSRSLKPFCPRTIICLSRPLFPARPIRNSSPCFWTSSNSKNGRAPWGFLLPRPWPSTPPNSQRTALTGYRPRQRSRVFLRDASNYPLFGKPIASSHSFGAVSMKSLAEDGQSILLGNGVTVSVEDILGPIISDWADGYLLQRHMFNHPALKPHFGQATATSRIITLWAETGPEVLFFSQRLPSATAMHDNQSRNHRGHTNVNPATGVVESIAVVHRGAMRPRRHWNNPDAEFVGMEIPFHKETVSLCQNVHRNFPTLAMIGFDIAITTDGPIISEANLNPYLSSLQGVTMTGVYSEPMYSKFMTAKRLAHAAQQQVGV